MDEPSDAYGADADEMAALEDAPIALLFVSLDYRVLMANRAFRRLLGYELDDLVGMPIIDLICDLEPMISRWNDFMDSGISAEREHTLWHRDGHIVRVRTTSMIVYHASGEPRGFLAQAIAP